MACLLERPTLCAFVRWLVKRIIAPGILESAKARRLERSLMIVYDRTDTDRRETIRVIIAIKDVL